MSISDNMVNIGMRNELRRLSAKMLDLLLAWCETWRKKL